jgi:hypothetical protein
MSVRGVDAGASLVVGHEDVDVDAVALLTSRFVVGGQALEEQRRVQPSWVVDVGDVRALVELVAEHGPPEGPDCGDVGGVDPDLHEAQARGSAVGPMPRAAACT